MSTLPKRHNRLNPSDTRLDADKPLAELTDDFARSVMATVLAHWQEHGNTALEIMRRIDPSGFAKLCAGMVPKNVKMDVSKTDRFADMSLEDVQAEYERLRQENENALNSILCKSPEHKH